jgi:nucleoid-associated protein YgaU
MGFFGSSLEAEVPVALDGVRGKVPGLRSLDARIDGKVVTLAGEAEDLAVRPAAMHAFDAAVETENTVNQIRLAQPPAAFSASAPVPTPASEVWHEVMRGDTPSGLVKTYSGSAGRSMKIFDASRDQLSDPNVIHVGQKLRIPQGS